MNKKILAMALVISGTIALTACSDNEVADVSLGIFTLKDIKLNSFVDPLVPGVTCHVASIEANLSLSDPSDSAVSCRQTGEITPEMIARIKKGKTGEVVFEKSKSVFLKTLKIRRILMRRARLLCISPTRHAKPQAASNTVSPRFLSGVRRRTLRRVLKREPCNGVIQRKRNPFEPAANHEQ